MTRETSLQAYRFLEDSGALTRLKLLVAHDISEHGPTTQAETTARLSHGRPSKYVHSFQQRFSELEERDVIEFVGERTCAVTGKNCRAYTLTGRLPKKLEHKATRVELERQRCLRAALDVIAIAQTREGRLAAEEVARRIQGAAA